MTSTRRPVVKPTLRFREFTLAWEKVLMGVIYPQIRNGFVGTATPFYCENGVRYVQGRNVKSGKIQENGFVSITEAFHRKCSKSQLKANDIVMVQSGHVGECAAVSEAFADTNCHALLVLTPNADAVVSEFYVSYFYAPAGRRQIHTIKTGNTVAHILSSDLKDVTVPSPTLPEQQKIADFLTAVDGRIQQLSQKRALLQDYKKGVMQQLFTQALRFKDDLGNEFPDWEEKRVEEMFQVTRGKVLAMPETHSQRSPEFQYPVYSSQTSNNGLAGYYDTFLFRDAITWTTDGANAGDVKFRKGEFYCTNVCGVLLSDNGYANEFVAAMLGTVTRKHVSYVGNPKLMNNVMSQISISVPSSLSEQTKIANFLTALDRTIESVSQQIALTQTFKRGLLQQMFV